MKSTRKVRPAAAKRKRAAAKARPRSGQGNPAWGKAFVTQSHRQNFEPDEYVKKAPLSFSAAPAGSHAPGDYHTRSVEMTIAQSGYLAPFTLELKAYSPPKGWQTFYQVVTLEQLYSFEEAVRAVFQAAREEGILPSGV